MTNPEPVCQRRGGGSQVCGLPRAHRSHQPAHSFEPAVGLREAAAQAVHDAMRTHEPWPGGANYEKRIADAVLATLFTLDVGLRHPAWPDFNSDYSRGYLDALDAQERSLGAMRAAHTSTMPPEARARSNPL